MDLQKSLRFRFCMLFEFGFQLTGVKLNHLSQLQKLYRLFQLNRYRTVERYCNIYVFSQGFLCWDMTKVNQRYWTS